MDHPAAGGMAMTRSRVIAGIGCRHNCPEADILAALDRACRAAGRAADALATADFKAREPGLLAAASLRGLAVIAIDRAALTAAQPRCATTSAATLRAIGLGSVAEASALAATGASGWLLLPRLVAGSATCALAAAP